MTSSSVLKRNPAIDPLHSPRVRTCLVCKDPFHSEWAGERVCIRCKKKLAWKQGTQYKIHSIRGRS